MVYRSLSEDEQRLLLALADVVPELGLDAARLGSLLVEPMDDGGMGSLRLSNKIGSAPRIAAELLFTDADGVEVIVSLFVDEDGTPLELDIWKVNYEPVVEIPATLPTAKRFRYDDEHM